MQRRTSDGGSAAGMAELVADLGSATPAPLFYIDDSGRTHALNSLAEGLPDDHPAAEAFLSPVAGGSGHRGHVVAYLDDGQDEVPGPVVAAMVALTAEIVSRRLGESSKAEAPLPPGDAAVELALCRLAELLEVDAIAAVLADAAVQATGAERAVVFSRHDDARLEARACRGMRRATLGRGVPASGLLGWAATRGMATVAGSLLRLPESAPRDEGRDGPLATWLAPPFVLVPLSSGAHVVGLLAVSGLPARLGAGAARSACSRLERLAERAGSALAGALIVTQARRDERVRQELEIARQIQRRLLPSRAMSFPGLQLAGDCRAAAQVGGDWHGFRATGEDALVASIFDVAGHGIGAAFCMTLVHSALRAELARGGSPSEVLDRTNELASEDLAESGLFATGLLVRFDRRAGEITYASAGHSRPVHWSRRDRRFVEHAQSGLPVGLFGDSRYPEASARFGEGDLLVLYTDGIVEAENARGEQFGRARLVGAIHGLRRKPARVVLRRLWRAIDRFTGGALRDDATLVVVRGDRGFGPREEAIDVRRGSSRAEAEASTEADANADARTRLGRRSGTRTPAGIGGR